MKCKRFFAGLALLLLLAGCQEQEPAPINKGSGGTLVSQETASSSEGDPGSEDGKPYEGKTLSYEFMDFKGDEMFPVIYEFTVNQVQIFGNYSEAGLPEEKVWDKYCTNQEFILLDVTIKKTKGLEKAESSNMDSIECLKLVNSTMRQAEKNGKNNLPQVYCYFSGYSGGDGFDSYWLDPGEETQFQIGWCLSEYIPQGKESNTVSLWDTEGLALYVGMDGSLQGDCIELTE